MNCDGFPEPGCDNKATNRVLGYDLCDSCARAYAGMSEATQDDDEITPSRAIRESIVNLRLTRRRIGDEPDAIAHIDELIEALETALYQLREYDKLRGALAVLRAAMP